MLGTTTALLSLLLVPLGFLLAWWIVRNVDRRGTSRITRTRAAIEGVPSGGRHRGPLDDAPADVIAAVVAAARRADPPGEPA